MKVRIRKIPSQYNLLCFDSKRKGTGTGKVRKRTHNSAACYLVFFRILFRRCGGMLGKSAGLCGAHHRCDWRQDHGVLPRERELLSGWRDLYMSIIHMIIDTRVANMGNIKHQGKKNEDWTCFSKMPIIVLVINNFSFFAIKKRK